MRTRRVVCSGWTRSLALAGFCAIGCAMFICVSPARASLRFELSDRFGPMAIHGELIDNIYQKDIDGDGMIEVILAASSSYDSGVIYVYSPYGALEWQRTFAGSGIHLSIRDFDKDGTDEILVRLGTSKTLYVISHTGGEECSCATADNVVYASWNNDLNGDGVNDLIVFSRDTSVPCGQVTVFDLASQSMAGARAYAADDLSGTHSPGSALVRDLDGDGVKEIIPSPSSLSKRLEILDSTAAVRTVKTFDRDVETYKVVDLDLDGKDDVIVDTEDDSGESVIHAYLNYDGNDFTSSWIYPQSGAIKAVEYLNVDAGKIAFGTMDSQTYSGCKVYLLDAATGQELASPVDVMGLVDDLYFKDLNGDGMRELAVLTKEYTEAASSVEDTPDAEVGKSGDGPQCSADLTEHSLGTGTSSWTIKTYDQSLNLLTPTGHHTYSLDGRYYDDIRVADLSNDGLFEIIPYRRTGNNLYVVRYDGVLKWQSTLDGEIDTLGYGNDLDNDGRKDLVVGTEHDGGTSGSVYTFADGGDSGILLGSKAFPGRIKNVYKNDFDNDGYFELVPVLENGANLYAYSYDFTSEILNNSLSGNEIQDIDYTCDIDANGIDDLFIAANDTASGTCYLYLYRGLTGRIDVRLSGDMLRTGNAFIVDVTVPPIDQRFNAWGVISGKGVNYSMVLGKPHALHRGLEPLITGVPGLANAYEGRLFEISSIPPGVPSGAYTITIGLVGYGMTPRLENAIPGYLFRKEVYINSANSSASDLDELPETVMGEE